MTYTQQERKLAAAYMHGREQRRKRAENPEYMPDIPREYTYGSLFDIWMDGWRGYTCVNLYNRMREIHDATQE